MKHLGDITKINGADAPVVNVIIGGSPCQDLSVAGKRAGLAGERSGLFMEQIRIIKEMREADEARGRTDEHIRPRFMVWENVPGAFSSNGGADFGAVLQETVKVVCREAPPIPMFGKGWPPSGCLADVEGKWSVAWRVFDAQFWGVPQRRRRIALVADFGGLAAPEILFERESVSGDSEKSTAAWKRATGNTENSLDTAGSKSTYCIQGNCIDRAETAGCNGKGWTEGVSYTLNTIDRPAVVFNEEAITSKLNASNPHFGDACHTLGATGAGRTLLIQEDNNPFVPSPPQSDVVVFEPGSCSRVGGHIWQDGKAPDLRAQSGDNQPAIALENHPNDSRVKIAEDGIVQTLSGRMGTGGGNTPMILEKHIPCSWDGGQTSPTLTKSNAGGQQRTPDNDNFNAVIALDRASFNQGKNAQYDFEVSESGINSSLVAKGPSAVCSKEKSECERYIVRRLTPLECERLQGFPDQWTDIGEWTDSKGKLHKESSDSARYKALGNSIALPFWDWMLRRMARYLPEGATLGSLFDGISGFNVCWARIHGAENCLWSSEIEEFPIAVVKKHFGDEDTGEEGDFEKFFRRDEKENV